MARTLGREPVFMRVTRFLRGAFPILAVVAGLSLVVGLFAPGEVPGSLRLLEFVAIVWTHTFAAIYLGSTEEWVGTTTNSGSLPDWVLAQAEKNRRRASVYVLPGLLIFFAMALARDKGWIVGSRLIGLMGFNLAFQVGALLGEFAILAAQARLVGDVEGWVAGSG
jgi:hypothetical protein